ncbi:hypothetical protein V8C37DRAFT_219443 [Trichoderma ceciliae]
MYLPPFCALLLALRIIRLKMPIIPHETVGRKTQTLRLKEAWNLNLACTWSLIQSIHASPFITAALRVKSTSPSPVQSMNPMIQVVAASSYTIANRTTACHTTSHDHATNPQALPPTLISLKKKYPNTTHCAFATLQPIVGQWRSISSHLCPLTTFLLTPRPCCNPTEAPGAHPMQGSRYRLRGARKDGGGVPLILRVHEDPLLRPNVEP